MGQSIARTFGALTHQYSVVILFDSAAGKLLYSSENYSYILFLGKRGGLEVCKPIGPIPFPPMGPKGPLLEQSHVLHVSLTSPPAGSSVDRCSVQKPPA